jgi:flagellar protein FliS
MLMDAALQRMAGARGCIERGELTSKAKLLHSSVILLAELRGSLDLGRGGVLAQNLSDLYDYMIRRLMLANLNSDARLVAEAAGLLAEIRSAWVAIGPEVRGQSPSAASAA